MQRRQFMAGLAGTAAALPLAARAQQGERMRRIGVPTSAAVSTVAAQPNGGILFPLDLTVGVFMDQTIVLVARHRLPAVYSERFAVERGGLMFYGADRIDIFRRAASYVDRILRGEKPSDLPYQQPTKYDLVINRKTASARPGNSPEAAVHRR